MFAFYQYSGMFCDLSILFLELHILEKVELEVREVKIMVL